MYRRRREEKEKGFEGRTDGRQQFGRREQLQSCDDRRSHSHTVVSAHASTLPFQPYHPFGKLQLSTHWYPHPPGPSTRPQNASLQHSSSTTSPRRWSLQRRRRGPRASRPTTVRGHPKLVCQRWKIIEPCRVWSCYCDVDDRVELV
jgi:hypothetical protein